MSESKKVAMSTLEQLKSSGTLVVADTGDFEVGEQSNRVATACVCVCVGGGGCITMISYSLYLKVFHHVLKIDESSKTWAGNFRRLRHI